MGGNYRVAEKCLLLLWYLLLFQQNNLYIHGQQVDIECIPLENCPIAMKLVSTKKYAPETMKFLRTSHCGHSEKSGPLVWCPNLNYCVTPNNENGTCVDLNQCPSLLRRSASTADLSTYRCNKYLENNFHVCCSNQEPQEMLNRLNEDPQNLQDLSKDYGRSGEMQSDQPRFPINPYPDHNPHKKPPHSHGSIKTRFHDDYLDEYSDHSRNFEDAHQPWYTSNRNFPDSEKNKDLPHDLRPEVNRHNHETSGRTTSGSNDRGYWGPKTSLDMSSMSYEATTTSNMGQTWSAAANSEFPSKVTMSPSRFSSSSIPSKGPSSTSSSASSTPKYEGGDKRSTSRTLGTDSSVAFENISRICGRQTANIDRIIGGRAVDLGEFPWMALLEYTSNNGRKFGCGGALINKRYVLTAAHCVDQGVLQARNLRLYRVLLGEYDTRNASDCIYSPLGSKCADPPIYFGISSVLPHEGFDNMIAVDDVALIRLDRDVVFTDYIRPICLPDADFTMKVNESFTVAGWGKTSSTDGGGSPVLMKTRLQLVQNAACERYGGAILRDGQRCAGVGGGVDTCTGDSGGPMMVERVRNFEVVTYAVGVVSYGLGAGCGNAPSVNTHLPPYVDWISRNVR